MPWREKKMASALAPLEIYTFHKIYLSRNHVLICHAIRVRLHSWKRYLHQSSTFLKCNVFTLHSNRRIINALPRMTVMHNYAKRSCRGYVYVVSTDVRLIFRVISTVSSLLPLIIVYFVRSREEQRAFLRHLSLCCFREAKSRRRRLRKYVATAGPSEL